MTFSEWTRSKNPILALMMMGMMTMPAWGVGTVTQTLNTLGAQNWVLAINWTGDSVNGTVPATLTTSAQIIQGYRVFAVEIAPGSPAPTNLYSVTLTTFLGVDVLGGGGASLSNTTGAALQIPATAPPVNGALTFNLSGNSVAGAKGNVLVYFAPIAQVTGLLAPTGPSLTGNNLLSGNNSFSGTTTLSGPVVITGTDSGASTISGNKTFSGANAFTGANVLTPGPTSAIASSPTGATESGTTVTITTTATCAFTTGQWVTVAGVTNASYNGIAQVLAPGCNGGSSFTFTAGISGFAASGSGSVAPANILNSGSEFGLVRGNITPTTAAGPTGANNENFLFVSGNCNPTTEYNFIHSQNATENLTGCIEAPVGGFAPVYNGIAGYATNNLNASANGLYGEARCRVNNSSCWGTDTSSRAESGLTGVNINGAEYELYPKNTTDIVNGAKIGGDFPVQPTAATGFEVLVPNFLAGTGQWTSGLTIDSGATTGVGVNIGLTAASGNSLGSQKIQFNSKDAGGVVRQPSINSDLAGNIFMNVTSGGQSVVINGPASSVNVTAIVNPSGTPLAIPTVGNNVISDTATQTLTNKTLNVPLTSGTGLQIFNTTTTCTTGASVGATCTTANISLPVAEADTSYRVTCTGKGLTNVPVVIATTNASASQFTITAAALTAAAASFASYDCVAGHN